MTTTPGYTELLQAIDEYLDHNDGKTVYEAGYLKRWIFARAAELTQTPGDTNVAVRQGTTQVDGIDVSSEVGERMETSSEKTIGELSQNPANLSRESRRILNDEPLAAKDGGEQDAAERYVTFHEGGIKVDIARYLKTPAGKAALDRMGARPEPIAWLMRDHEVGRLEVCSLEPQNRHRVNAFPVYAQPLASQMPTKDISISFGGSTHTMPAEEWLKRARAFLKDGGSQMRPQSSVQGWQPIETIAVGVTVALLDTRRHMSDDILGYRKDIGYLTGDGWFSTMGEYRGMTRESFTHWMPLPSAPQPPQGEG